MKAQREIKAGYACFTREQLVQLMENFGIKGQPPELGDILMAYTPKYHLFIRMIENKWKASHQYEVVVGDRAPTCDLQVSPQRRDALNQYIWKHVPQLDGKDIARDSSHARFAIEVICPDVSYCRTLLEVCHPTGVVKELNSVLGMYLITARPDQHALALVRYISERVDPPHRFPDAS